MTCLPFTEQPPTASIQQDRLTITQGTTGTLRCDVTGKPAPTITWTKVRAELGPNHQVYPQYTNCFILSCVYIILLVNSFHTGLQYYKCH